MGASLAIGEAISGGISNAISLLGQAWTALTSNEVLVIFVGVTLLGSGITLFRKLRKGT